MPASRVQSQAMKFLVTVAPDPESGGFVSSCPQLPGCWSQGETQNEALDNIKAAIAAIMELRAEEGWPPPAEVVAVELEVPAA